MQQTADGLIKPNYGDGLEAGTTIGNIPATAAALMGAPFQGLPPLPSRMWEPVLASGPVKRVVVILVDGMGQNHFEGARPAALDWVDDQPVVTDRITSVFPSTTVNALTCLWTGHAPGQHSLVGIKFLFPEYGTVGNMLGINSVVPHGRVDGLIEAGLVPEEFIPVPSVAEQMAQSGIPTVSIKPKEIVNSGLSRMHDRKVEQGLGSVSFADMMWQTADLLNKRPGEPLYIFDYMPSVDTLSHLYGWQHPVVQAERDMLLNQIRSTLIGQLTPEAKAGTVVIVTADHGQMMIDRAKAIKVREYPEFREFLVLDGAGEPRMPYLHVRHGRMDALKAFVADRFGSQMKLVDSEKLLADGWLGTHNFHPDTAHRMGDTVGIMLDEATFIPHLDSWIFNRFDGMHGGLLPDEMFVPFWAVRLG